jgi:hypothetical protein
MKFKKDTLIKCGYGTFKVIGESQYKDYDCVVEFQSRFPSPKGARSLIGKHIHLSSHIIGKEFKEIQNEK